MKKRCAGKLAVQISMPFKTLLVCLTHGNGSKWAVIATDPSGPVATM
jgi:hypothetical protein